MFSFFIVFQIKSMASHVRLFMARQIMAREEVIRDLRLSGTISYDYSGTIVARVVKLLKQINLESISIVLLISDKIPFITIESQNKKRKMHVHVHSRAFNQNCLFDSTFFIL